jgi:hypothetical protein
MADNPTLQDLLDEYDGNARSLHSFGALGDGSDEDAAIQSAFDWMNEVRGRALLVPAGMNYKFSTDKRILQSNSSIIGIGKGYARLSGQNGARIILGQSDQSVVGPSGLPQKNGTKVAYTTLYNVGFSPAGNHSGEVLLVDYADSTTIEMCQFGPSTQDGSTVTHGIKLNWYQWVYIRRCDVNVNGACIYMVLPATDGLQNEDHIHISECQLYNGKSFNASFVPSIVLIDWQVGRQVSVFEFEFRGNHCGRFPSSDQYSPTVQTGGITVSYVGAVTTGIPVFHAANICYNMWEYVDYPIDFKRSHSTSDASRINFIGNSVLSPRGVVFNGNDYTKSSVNISGNYFLQGVSLVDGFQGYFAGRNDISQFTGNVFVTPIARMRFWNKASNAGLTGYRLSQTQSVSVSAGAAYVDIVWSLSASPTIMSQSVINGGSWQTSFGWANVSATGGRLYFGTPAPVSTLVNVTAEVAEIA